MYSPGARNGFNTCRGRDVGQYSADQKDASRKSTSRAKYPALTCVLDGPSRFTDEQHRRARRRLGKMLLYFGIAERRIVTCCSDSAEDVAFLSSIYVFLTVPRPNP